jgi:hypothetical protein
LNLADMMRRSLGRIAQIAKASLAQQSTSLEIISLSPMISQNQVAVSLAASSNGWNSRSWRYYSSENGGDNDDGKSGNSVQKAGGNPPVPSLTSAAAAVSSPLDTEAALDAWGAAMDEG